MKLIFNKSGLGKSELKATLGFLDGDFSYQNIEPDIKINTPYLVDLIGKDIYEKIQDYYENEPNIIDVTDKQNHIDALKYMQIYTASMAYIDYAPNNDLQHTNAGRTFKSEENDKIPWDWQVNADNSAIKKRAYKALDLLFILLDKSGWTEWTGSDAYKKANALVIKNTNQFDAVFPINKSGQLFYRLVPFMDDIEKYEIQPILKPEKLTELKEIDSPDKNQKILINLCHKVIAHLSLGKAYKAFPVEMFPEGLIYNENTRMRSEARAEVMQFLNTEGQNYLKKLEYEFEKQNQTFNTINTTPSLEDGKPYVNL
ncbi:DUF6712 family protein [Abyssalbus ytuae]|uniref:Uncharacterized protein n=1 Tax=Abyssalbus ytuae TaxID=2926907 RepID=A0A9E6ZPV4_9FLAO|nr:DUF6712 family protein [Abyssalbus ytuae]UOB16578.1 hypothetical protein MQE35_12635 [Abyssalbus ytuae]